MTAYHVGLQVVCIKKNNWDLEIILKDTGKFIFPRYGQVLTIRAIRFGIRQKRQPFLVFNEIVNPRIKYDSGFYEPTFHPIHFKPLIETPAMSQIKDILDNPCAIKFNDEVEQYHFRDKVEEHAPLVSQGRTKTP